LRNDIPLPFGLQMVLHAGYNEWANTNHVIVLYHEHTLNDEALDQFLNDTCKYLKIPDGSSSLEIHLAYDDLTLEI